MAPIEFYYFKGFTGRGEVSRLMLHAGAPAADYKITDVDDLNYSQYGLGQLPFAVIDGQDVPQSAAIERAIARRYGYMPTDEAEIRLVEATYEQALDVQKACIIPPGSTTSLKGSLTTTAATQLGRLAKMYAKGDEKTSGPFLLAKPSIADFLTFHVVNVVSDYATYFKIANPVAQHPRLIEVRDAIAKLPSLSTYLSNPDRPNIHSAMDPRHSSASLKKKLPKMAPMINKLALLETITWVMGPPARATVQGMVVGAATAFVGLVMWGTYLHKQDVRSVGR